MMPRVRTALLICLIGYFASLGECNVVPTTAVTSQTSPPETFPTDPAESSPTVPMYSSPTDLASASPTDPGDTPPTDPPERPLSFYLDWLRRYGYIKGTNTLFTEETFHEALEDAQGFVGINTTGELDAGTRALMETPRCGVPDVNLGLFRKPPEVEPTTADTRIMVTRRPGSSIEFLKWEHHRLTYSFRNYSPDLKRAEIKETIAEAFRRWSDVTPLSFEPAPEGETPDIDIWFTSGDHGDENLFDGRGGILAHAFYPGPGLGGDMHFDEEEHFTVKSYIGTNLFFTALHELGHSLGLDHSRNFASVMAPLYRGYNPNVELHEDDIQAIQNLYGPRPTTTETTVSPTTVYIHPVCTLDNFDAVVYNDGELYIFKGTESWRIHRNRTVENIERFPGRPAHVVAGYKKWDGSIVLLNETHLWEYDSETYTPTDASPVPLRALHLPDHIEAAFYLRSTNKTYFYKNDSFWVLSDVIEVERPVIGIFTSGDVAGELPEVDAAFSDEDGSIFLVHGSQYSKIRLRDIGRVEEWYPRNFREDWLGCPTITTSGKNPKGNSARVSRTTSIASFVPPVVLLIMWAVRNVE